METTTTSAGSTEHLKVVETGGDIEVKIGRIREVENQSMTRNKTAKVPVLTQILVLIIAHLMTIKLVEKNRSSQKR